MNVILDTHVLLRLVTGDDIVQQRRASELLDAAEQVVIGVYSLCEFAWVLDRRYGVRRANVSVAIRQVLGMRNVVVNRPPIDAGLAMLDAGGDFADGVIAFEGRWLGGENFVSFDRKSVKLLERSGTNAMPLS